MDKILYAGEAKYLDTLRKIYDFLEKHDYYPTYLDLANEMETVQQTAYNHVQKLKQYGLVKCNKKGRIISITHPNDVKQH